MRYKVKHREIEAFRFGSSGVPPDWFKSLIDNNQMFIIKGVLVTYSLSGTQIAEVGDWVVKNGNKYEFYSNDEFERHYEVVT